MTDRNDRHERLREGSRFLTEAIEHYRQHRYTEASAASEIAAGIFASLAADPDHGSVCIQPAADDARKQLDRVTTVILAEAVIALYNRFMMPYGQKQRLTTEQRDVIEEARLRAGAVLSSDDAFVLYAL